MVDILDKRAPSVLKRAASSSALKRGPETSVRRVKRARHSLPDCRSEFAHVHVHPAAAQLAPGNALRAPVDTASNIGADIRRAVTAASEWTFRVPLLFWVAVSRAHILAQLYWRCRSAVDGCEASGTAKPCPLKVAKGLARWLRPVLPEMPTNTVYDFLLATGLQEVVDNYVDLLQRASRLGLYFSNDFGTEQHFDAEVHEEMGEGLLRPGDRCLVGFPATFPATLVRVGAEKTWRVVSKRYVLPTQALEGELETLRQELRR